MIASSLQELTGKESGAFSWEGNDEICVMNWTNIEGLPRFLGNYPISWPGFQSIVDDCNKMIYEILVLSK